jgi:hypothetical protein
VPLSGRESVAGVAAGIVANVFVIVVGLSTPLDHPARDRADNALVSLGVIGLLLVLVLPPSGFLSRTPPARAALVVYAALSLVAVLMADFGARAALGWSIKIAAAIVMGVVLLQIVRGERRSRS